MKSVELNVYLFCDFGIYTPTFTLTKEMEGELERCCIKEKILHRRQYVDR